MQLLLLLLMAAAAVQDGQAMPPDWNPPSLPGGGGSGSGGFGGSPLATPSRCVPIPASLELCSNIGYAEMRLPNMLNHDSVAEVRDNTKQWLPLTRTECHRDVRILLCSVYAPVCIHQLPDKQIKPCRSLCEAVRQPCAAFMQGFGFAWPEMLNCSQFPPDSDLMCIKSSISTTAECRACPERVTYESIIGNFCINKFVLKARLDVLPTDTSGRDAAAAAAAAAVTRLRLRGRLRHFKTDDVDSRRQFRSAVVDTAGCRCGALEAGGDSGKGKRRKFLIMGSAQPDGSLSVGFLAEWDRGNRQFRRAIRQIRRSQRRSRLRFGGGGLCRSGGSAGGGIGGVGGTNRRLPDAMPQPMPTTEAASLGDGGGGGRPGRRGRGNRRNKKRRRNNGRNRGDKKRRNKNNRRNGDDSQGRRNRRRPSSQSVDDAERRDRRRDRRNRNRLRQRAPATLPPPPPPPPRPQAQSQAQPPAGNRYSYDSFYYSDYKT